MCIVQETWTSDGFCWRICWIPAQHFLCLYRVFYCSFIFSIKRHHWFCLENPLQLCFCYKTPLSLNIYHHHIIYCWLKHLLIGNKRVKQVGTNTRSRTLCVMKNHIEMSLLTHNTLDPDQRPIWSDYTQPVHKIKGQPQKMSDFMLTNTASKRRNVLRIGRWNIVGQKRSTDHKRSKHLHRNMRPQWN